MPSWPPIWTERYESVRAGARPHENRRKTHGTEAARTMVMNDGKHIIELTASDLANVEGGNAAGVTYHDCIGGPYPLPYPPYGPMDRWDYPAPVSELY